MTERDYAIRSFKEITLNASRHTEERMDAYYKKIKELMNNYQDLILENQMVLDELEQECQEKINENMAYALQYMDAYDYRMNLGKLKKEVNNIILIYGLCNFRVCFQMTILSMNRNRIFRFYERIDQLQFFLTGMS